MKIISLINSKGGVGKTTLCANLCRYVQVCNSTNEHEISVLLVDADQQGSSREWFGQGGSELGFDLIALDTKSSLQHLQDLKVKYDYVFIDTPGKAGDVLATAIVISDLILIPVQPSPYDLWATSDVAEIVSQRQLINNGKPECKYILNRCIPNTNALKGVKEHMNTCTFELLNQCIYQRQVYSEMAKDGKTIFESNNKQSIAEMIKLGDEIMRLLDGL